MKKGTIYIITMDSYSDYGIYIVVRALKDFDYYAEVRAYASSLGEDVRPRYDNLFDRLIALGFVELADGVEELNVGDGGLDLYPPV